MMWLQAHTPRWGTWRTGAAKAQKGNDALADSAPPQAPRPHATRKGSSRPGSRPAHLQPLRIHGSHRAGSRPPGGALAAAQQKSQGLPAPQPRPKSRSRSGTRREGRGGAALPLAAGGRGRALNAGICAEEVLRGRRRCEDPEEGLRVGKGERHDGAEGEGV